MNEGKELVGIELCIDDDKKALTAAEALDKARIRADGKPLFTLACTPTFCGFVSPSDGGLVALEGPKKDKFDVADVFELRCFCEDFELRWVREGKSGRAVTVTEEEPGDQNNPKFFKRLGQYILWGKGAKRDGGIRLFEHRVGELPVPIPVNQGERAYLSFVEYFLEDKYGNMTWHSERLTGFSSSTSEPGA